MANQTIGEILKRKTMIQALVEAADRQKMHVVNAFFIRGMAEKERKGETFLVAELLALEQFHDYYVKGLRDAQSS